jgi:hypothetical protein
MAAFAGIVILFAVTFIFHLRDEWSYNNYCDKNPQNCIVKTTQEVGK